VKVSLTINGQQQTADVEPRLLLVDFIRGDLRLTGTHVGCDTTGCGACTVLLDGEPVKSCTMLTVQADGHALTTVEGLANGAELHPVQTGFHEEHGLQCGFCTPGMMLVAAALLERNPDPTERDIRWAISGNVCRCTGYVNIVKAVRHAARLRSEGARAPVGEVATAPGGAS
jgi:carbon-monoxide dehydrogenase small subunit